MNIEAKNLSKIYGDGENRVVALDHANLEIVSSDFISIMGPSGSGKSTMLHLLSGLDKPSSGSLTYDGKDIYSYSDKELSAFRRKRIGFIFQQFNLLPVLTAKENIIMPLLLDKQKPDEAYLKQLTELLGIQGRLEHLPHELSGGQQQRVAIARALIATVYKGNIIKNLIMDCQSYTKYRPNETTGGIFVSWRRKEELPTGA